MDYSDWWDFNAYGYIYMTWINNPKSSMDGCIYIGQRKMSCDNNKTYYGSGRKIRAYIKKYGDFGLNRIVIDFAENQEELNQLEFENVRLFLGNKNCLNLRAGGSKSGITEETRNKIILATLGHPVPQYVRDKLSKENIGKKLSEHTKRKIRESMKNINKGKKHYNNGEIEVFCHIKPEGFVEGVIRKPDFKPPMLNKKHSEETKKKMSKFQKEHNPMKGKIWITNGVCSMVIDKDSCIPDGFVKGRGKRKNKSKGVT